MKIKIHTAEADLSTITVKLNTDYSQPGSKFAAILQTVMRLYFISESKQAHANGENVLAPVFYSEIKQRVPCPQWKTEVLDTFAQGHFQLI